MNIEAMVNGYLECQLWAGLDYDHVQCSGDTCPDILVEYREPHPYDENYGMSDISDEYRAAVTDELSEVVRLHPIAVRMYLNRTTVLGNMRNVHNESQFGHDFYLTREHHGAGFWDRGLGELGDYLTEIADSYGSATQLWERDGKLYGE